MNKCTVTATRHRNPALIREFEAEVARLSGE
jgi:hypothetical protein